MAEKSGKNYKMFTIPMTFMLIITGTGIDTAHSGQHGCPELYTDNFPLLLLALAVVLAAQGYKIITNKTEAPIEK